MPKNDTSYVPKLHQTHENTRKHVRIAMLKTSMGHTHAHHKRNWTLELELELALIPNIAISLSKACTLSSKSSS